VATGLIGLDEVGAEDKPLRVAESQATKVFAGTATQARRISSSVLCGEKVYVSPARTVSSRIGQILGQSDSTYSRMSNMAQR
jgi:hypothetical protein